MALNTQKQANTQKQQEMKDESQTNGKYKTRQIITKIKGLSLTHTHNTKTIQKEKKGKERKQESDLVSKENQKWYQPVKDKTNQNTNLKTNKTREPTRI